MRHTGLAAGRSDEADEPALQNRERGRLTASLFVPGLWKALLTHSSAKIGRIAKSAEDGSGESPQKYGRRDE